MLQSKPGLRQVSSRWELALDLHVFGHSLLQQGRMELAQRIFAESEAGFRQEQDPWGLGIALIDLGVMALKSGQPYEAEVYIKDGLAAILESPSLWSISNALALLGAAAAHKTQAERAVQLFGASQKLREQAGFSDHTMYKTMIEEGLQAARQQLSEMEFSMQWQEGWNLTKEQVIALAFKQPSNRQVTVATL